MKVELSREEIVDALEWHVSTIIGSKAKCKATCTMRTYGIPSSLEFEIEVIEPSEIEKEDGE